MPRRKPTEDEKRRMWAAISKAAKDYHNHPEDRGLGKLIAKDAGVKPQSVSDWKNGKTAPEERHLLRLASLYGVSASELAGDEPAVTGALPTDRALRLASELTSTVTQAALPEASLHQMLQVMERAHELIIEGKTEDEAFGILFRYALGLKESDGASGA